jgi:hypothetical protein
VQCLLYLLSAFFSRRNAMQNAQVMSQWAMSFVYIEFSCHIAFPAQVKQFEFFIFS